MMVFPRTQLLFLLLVLLELTESNRKSKKTKEYKSRTPTYEISNSNYLPSDSQVTTFLTKGELKQFFYWSPINNGSLSVTIMTCSSPVHWSMKLKKSNSTVNLYDKEETDTLITTDMTTRYFTAFKEVFVLYLVATESDTYLHVYISTEEDGPQALRNSHMQKLRLQKRQKRKRLTIRWDQSLVDPQNTDYCLTVSPKKSYKTLCSAQAEKFGVVPPSSTKKPLSASQTVITYQAKDTDADDGQTHPLIACVGHKRQYTVKNLKQGQIYYFSLFATNRQSNLTYFFASTSTKFDGRIKPIILKDGKSSSANLRKYDGKVVFRFKVGKSKGNPLNIFIMSCGALMDVEITLKGNLVVSQERIEKFHHITINSPVEGGRYYIKILTVNMHTEEANENSKIEVFATAKSHIPLPTMPNQTTVEEIKSLRRCDSVTVAWVPSPNQKVGHYCLLVKEGEIRESGDYYTTNQCVLDGRLKKSVDFMFSYCKYVRHNYTNPITEKIKYLYPGKSYLIQVTVKKPKGKSLPYDLLQVRTKPTCHIH